MQIVRDSISLDELKKMAEKMMGRLVKAVVDVDQKIMAVDAIMHADQEAELLNIGSQQKDLWGINLHPKKFGTDDFIEFDSMINLRVSWGNRTRGIDSPITQKAIRSIVSILVTT